MVPASIRSVTCDADHDQARAARRRRRRCVDPPNGVVISERAGVRNPGEAPTRTSSPVLSRASCWSIQRRRFRVTMRARNAAVVDGRVVAHRVLGRDLAFAEAPCGRLPVARAVADRVDVLLVLRRCLSAAMPLRLSNSTPDVLEAEVFPLWARGRWPRASDRPRLCRRQCSNSSPAAGAFDSLGDIFQVELDAALAELLGEEFLGGVGSSCWNQRRQHLDDGHLGAEEAEVPCELAADDAAAEDDEPVWGPGSPRGGRCRRRSRDEWEFRRSAGGAGTSRSR